MKSWTIRLALTPATKTSDLTSELMGQPTPQTMEWSNHNLIGQPTPQTVECSTHNLMEQFQSGKLNHTPNIWGGGPTPPPAQNFLYLSTECTQISQKSHQNNKNIMRNQFKLWFFFFGLNYMILSNIWAFEEMCARDFNSKMKVRGKFCPWSLSLQQVWFEILACRRLIWVWSEWGEKYHIKFFNEDSAKLTHLHLTQHTAPYFQQTAPRLSPALAHRPCTAYRVPEYRVPRTACMNTVHNWERITRIYPKSDSKKV
jgi:hypothetical protein